MTRSYRRLLVAAVAGLCLPSPVSPAEAQLGFGPGRLEEHRDQARRGGFAKPVQEGVVTVVDRAAGSATVAVPVPILDRFEDQDHVELRLDGRRVMTRLVTAGTYQALLDDPGLLATLDVDILLVADGGRQVRIVALAGTLPDWLASGLGRRLVLSRR